MAHESFSGIIAGAMTSVGLGLIWLAVAGSFPSLEEFSGVPLPETIRLSSGSSPSVSPPPLDLTIPRSAPLPSELSMPQREVVGPQAVSPGTSVAAQLHARDSQLAAVRCDAEIVRICPESPDGSAHSRCLEQRMTQLSGPCRTQVRERLVKWKDMQSRVLVACEADVKRFCRADTSRKGLVVQCLQSHAPDVSDRCYQTLPKGTLYVR